MNRSIFEVSNSITKLIPGNDLSVPGLQDYLSYPDKNKQFAYKKRTGKFKEFRVSMAFQDPCSSGLLFPSGLLKKVQEYLNSLSCSYIVSDLREKPSTQDKKIFRQYGSIPTLRPYQNEIVQNCVLHNRGVVEAATGTGKTLCMAELVYQLGYPTLIIVPSINICKQFYNVLIGIYGKAPIGMIGGGKKQIQKDIVIATFQSLIDMPQEFFNKFKVLLLDECHHAAAETIQTINISYLNHIYYRYYFTATPFRNDGADMALEGVISGDKIYEYGFRKAIRDGYLVPPLFLFFNHTHQLEKRIKANDYNSEYTALISENQHYNEKVAETALKMRSKRRHTMVFVKHIKQGELLRDLIPESVLITGQETMKESEKILQDFEAKQFDILIGTSVIGEGVDLKSVDCGIMAGAGRAKSDVIQKIGRLLRPFEGKKHVLIIDFSHDQSKYNKRHALERRKIYEQYKTKIYDL